MSSLNTSSRSVESPGEVSNEASEAAASDPGRRGPGSGAPAGVQVSARRRGLSPRPWRCERSRAASDLPASEIPSSGEADLEDLRGRGDAASASRTCLRPGEAARRGASSRRTASRASCMRASRVARAQLEPRSLKGHLSSAGFSRASAGASRGAQNGARARARARTPAQHVGTKRFARAPPTAQHGGGGGGRLRSRGGGGEGNRGHRVRSRLGCGVPEPCIVAISHAS